MITFAQWCIMQNSTITDYKHRYFKEANHLQTLTTQYQNEQKFHRSLLLSHPLISTVRPALNRYFKDYMFGGVVDGCWEFKDRV